MTFLISRLKPSLERQIEAYELIGTNYVDEKHDIQTTIHMWKAAMALRLKEPSVPIIVDSNPNPLSAYNYAQEPRSMKDLMEIIHVPDAVYMQVSTFRLHFLARNIKC